MREPASYDKDAHTIVINSLEDDSDIEQDEARFMFNMPGSVNSSFSTTGIPTSLIQHHALKNQEQGDNSQLVLYKGKPEEVIVKTLLHSSPQESEPQASRKMAKVPWEHVESRDESEMELD